MDTRLLRSIVLTLSYITVIANARTIYVDSKVVSGGNGASWQTAFARVDVAVEAASREAEEGVEVKLWLRAGHYSVAQAIQLKSGMAIHGGFVGNEDAIDQRKYINTQNETTVAIAAKNKSVIEVGGSAKLWAENILISGLTLTGVQADDAMASGLFLRYCSDSVKISQCRIKENVSAFNGAGIRMTSSRAVLTRCKISENLGVGKARGAGLYVDGESASKWVRCIFSENKVEGDYAGAVCLATQPGYGLDFIKCNFLANEAGSCGSAIYTSSDLLLDDCCVNVNRTRKLENRGGAVYAAGSARSDHKPTIELTGVTILSNNVAGSATDNPVGGISLSCNHAILTTTEKVMIDPYQSPLNYHKLDVKTVLPDLIYPEITAGPPTPGRIVKQWFPEYENTGVYHTIYLPTAWKPGNRYPVFVDMPGNGPFDHQYGDRNDGQPGSSPLGYGISEGEWAICVGLPSVCTKTLNHVGSYGDVQATVAYCKKLVRHICENYGGDPEVVFMTGFSRGAMGTGFIGRYDDEISDLWLGFINYDGWDWMIEPHIHMRSLAYNYAEGSYDLPAVKERFARIRGCACYIVNGGWSKRAEVLNQQYGFPFRNQRLKYRNHNPAWILCDIPVRRDLREWVQDVIKNRPGR